MNYQISDIVCSIAGRDNGQKYIVWGIDNNMLLLVNGKARKIANPKKKKTKHVEFLKKVDVLVEVFENNKKINDAYLRKILSSEEKE